jgi:hypothetical protein
LQDVAQSVRRIAFIGTPHDGSDRAEWARLGERFLSMFTTTNRQLPDDLLPRSEKLAKLGVQFPEELAKRARNPATAIEVVCFFEGLSTRRGFDLGKVGFHIRSKADVHSL